MKIKDIMTTELASFKCDTPLSQAIKKMLQAQYSCVVILQDNKPIGILTERDIVKLHAEQLQLGATANPSVSKVMTKEPVCIKENMLLHDALILSENRQFRHLLVVDHNENIKGIVTQTDIRKAYVQLLEYQTTLEEKINTLQILSHEDALMGIGNRRAMEIEANYTESAAKRYGHNYSIALIDLDYFKRYNDYYGHQEGDEALIKTARAIESCQRKNDRLYRYGGEELLLLMSETDAESALIVAQRICEKFSQIKIENYNTPLGYLTVSIGIASGQDVSWKQLTKLADKALYKAKNSGRNQAKLAPQKP